MVGTNKEAKYTRVGCYRYMGVWRYPKILGRYSASSTSEDEDRKLRGRWVLVRSSQVENPDIIALLGRPDTEEPSAASGR
jgi:hypothetical protein